MITIGKHQVGAGQKPFIIAEVGSNWTSFDDCKDSIAKAASCGADAVKFQLFDEISLYGIPLDAESVYKHVPQEMRDAIRMASLQIEWLPKLKAKADACGIEFMCSAFSPELVKAVDPYVNVHKVASAELTHIRILEKLRTLGKPVILSTGASGEADIRGALEILKGVPVILMYCVAAYPANEVNLDTIPLLLSRFGVPVGYSDHTTDVLEIPRRAVVLGAVCIEKHFNAVNAVSPDSPHSLGVDQFRRMVLALRGGVQPSIGPARVENEMVVQHNRRVLATRDLPVGTVLKEGENFGIYRSLKVDVVAAHPFMIGSMVGKPVKRAIKAGDGIGPGDV